MKKRKRKYADGGLVKKFLKKRYKEAHVESEVKKVKYPGTPRLKPKSKP